MNKKGKYKCDKKIKKIKFTKNDEESQIKEKKDIEDYINKKKTSKIIFILILILLLIFISYIYQLPEDISSQDDLLVEKDKVLNFFNICSNGINLYKKSFKRKKNPKYSLIIPVLNQKRNLIKLIKSIQNQPYENIEIIFIDDHSIDGSIELINQFMLTDKRIILLKHQKNKGTFITRNNGVLAAKGEYILFIDPDDMFLENSLEYFNKATKKYPDIDIIQFRAIKKKGDSLSKWTKGYNPGKVVVQPELSLIMFYKDDQLKQRNYYLWDKIIKRNAFLKAIYKLGGYYMNQYMTLYEDGAMLFVLFSVAKNFIYLTFYGYLYCISSINYVESRYEYNKANQTIKNCFLFAEFLFNFSNNDLKSKSIVIYHLKRIYKKYYFANSFVTEGFDYIYRLLNKFAKCKVYLSSHRFIIYKLNERFFDIELKLDSY